MIRIPRFCSLLFDGIIGHSMYLSTFDRLGHLLFDVQPEDELGTTTKMPPTPSNEGNRCSAHYSPILPPAD